MRNAARPITKAEKSLFVISGVAIVLLVSIGLLNSSFDASPLIDYPAPAARPEPNGYDFYIAAAKATVRFTPEIDPENAKFYSNGLGIQKQQFALARRQAWLKANSQTFVLLQKATQMRTMVPNQRANFDSGYRDGNVLRTLGRDIAARGRIFQLEGHPYAASQNALDGIQMGCGVTKGGAQINLLLGTTIISTSRDVVEDQNRTLNQLSAEQCKSLAKRLEAIIGDMTPITPILQEEKWATLYYIQHLPERPNWFNMPEGATLKNRWQSQIASKKTIVDNVIHSFDDALALSKKPYSQTVGPIFQGNDYLSVWLAPNALKHLKRMDARSKVGLEFLLLRFVLRAYKLENGNYPSSLSALYPRYLKAIPTDDYGDDKPYFYRLRGNSYQLWSVGSDGKNDNGKPLAAKNKTENGQIRDRFQEGDYVAGENR